MEDCLEGFAEPSDYEVWACALLIYPAKGINGSCEAMRQVLGEEGIALYRKIFANNNSRSIKKFFT